MTYDPRGRTPEGRAEQLAEGRAWDRRDADLAHQPGSASSTVFDQITYWDQRLEECEAWWDRADSEWRGLRASFPPHPVPREAALVAAAEAERDRLAAECTRVRQLRDAALAEYEQIRRGTW